MPPKREDDYDDAALARALQEEYEREYRRRGMEQHLRRDDGWAPASSPASFPTAPTAEEVFDMDGTSFFSNNNPTGFFDEVEIGDEQGGYMPREQERVMTDIRRQQQDKKSKNKSRSQDPYGSSGLAPPISGTKRHKCCQRFL